MTVFTDGIFDDPMTQDDIEPAPGARRSAIIEDTISSLLGPSLGRAQELSESRGWVGKSYRQYSPDEARAFFEANGVGKHLTVEDRPYNQLELSILTRRKQAELKRRYVLDRAGGGFGRGAEHLALSLGTSLLDPLTVATGFVPVIGPTKYAALVERAGASALSRAGVRAGIGAVEGAAGAVVAEPFIYSAKQQEQADYSLYNSLANIAFGGVFGGGLHTVGGAVVDYRTARREGRGRAAAQEAAARLEARLEALGIERDATLADVDAEIQDRFAAAMAANPDRMAEAYGRLEDTDGGRIMSVDTARELSTDYLRDRTRSAAVHEPASALVKRMYAQRLAEAPGEGQDAVVLFSAGGTGSGKTTALAALGDGAKRAQVIYDTNMNSLTGSIKKIDQALAAGKDVRVMYVYRDPVDALVNGALPRAMRQERQHGSGRTVPLRDHAATHQGARETVPALMEHYKADLRVQFTIIDNSRGRADVRQVSLDELPAREYNTVREELASALEAEYAAGRISDAVYRGFRGPEEPVGQGVGQLRREGGRGLETGHSREHPDPVTAADRAEAASPQTREAALRGAVAQDLAGEPVNVEPAFELDPATRTKPLEDTLDELRRGPEQPVEEPVEIVESIDEAAINEQVAELEEELRGLEAETKLDDGEVPEDLRAEIEAADEAIAEANAMAEAAKLLVSCAMRVA